MGKHRFSLVWKYYPSDQSKYFSSGAYVFRPVIENNDGPAPYSTILNSHLFRGELVVDVLLWGDKTTSDLVMYRNEDALEIDTLVHSINIEDGRGKEIVMQV
jgi:alpha-mannosidase